MDPSFTCDSPADNLNFYKSYACGSVKVSRTAIEPTMKEIFSVVTEQDNISNLLYGDNSAQNHGHPYSESVLPGQSFMAYAGFYSDNAGFGSFSEAGECVLFDNKLINLNALPTIKFGSNVTSAQSANSLLNGSDMTVEYTNHKLNSDNDRRNYDCGVAGDGNGAWSSDLGSVGGIRKVTAVRYKYNKPLEPSEGLVMGLPFERAVTEDSLNLTDGTPIAWFAHRSHKNDISNVSTVKQSSYNPAPGSSAPIYDGGRVTTQPIKIRHDTEVSPGSIAPNEQMSISITPRLIGAAATGVDAFAKSARVTVRFQDNCVIPTAESLPNNATLILGNYGPDGVPCTSDDGPASSVSFDLGDIPVTGGNAVAPYGGSMATLEPTTFKALAVYTSSTSNKRLTTIISANNDLTNEFVNESFTEDRTELSSFVINGASSFGVLKIEHRCNRRQGRL